MTKEEVASIVKYCNDNGVSYKARLSELGVPEWKFFESKRRYAKEQVSSASPAGEFLQLTAGGDFVPMRYMYYTQPTDMRKSYNTLSDIVTDVLGCDPA